MENMHSTTSPSTLIEHVTKQFPILMARLQGDYSAFHTLGKNNESMLTGQELKGSWGRFYHGFS